MLGSRVFSRAPLWHVWLSPSPSPTSISHVALLVLLPLCLESHWLTEGPGELGAFSDSLHIVKESGDLF